ncbi:MAG: DUF1501 domain-containing protein [Nocardioides sp.]
MNRNVRLGTHPDPRSCGCPEASPGLSRRGFAKLLGGVGVATAMTLNGARVSFAEAAESSSSDRVFVLLSLRGGMDGLSVVVPAGDQSLRSARPNLAVPVGGLIRLDSRFGLHPAMKSIQPLWDNKKVAMVHATGLPEANRSHFSAMDEMERAAPGSSLRTGWLDRTMGLASDPETLEVTQVGTNMLPRAMAGNQPEFAMRSVDDVVLAFGDEVASLDSWREAVAMLHDGADPRVVGPLKEALRAVHVVRKAPKVAVEYPETEPGPALRDVARLIKANVGLTVASVDYGDWDMHVGQGRAGGGWIEDQLTSFSDSLAAFAEDLGPDLDRVTLLTLTEFGRRVEENGSGGTDHGYGSVSFVLGGGVNGGKVYGRWPGLAPDELIDGDLAVTTDYREVVGEVLTRRLGVTDLNAVFPDYQPQGLDVIRA